MKSKVRRKENYIETGGLFIDATFLPIPFVVVESFDIQNENGNEDKAKIMGKDFFSSFARLLSL